LADHSFSDVSFAINENDKIALMGKMEQESQRFSRLLLGKANRQQETYLHQRGCGSLFASAFIGY
jgi:ATPase subunit of ABC transporter with duplicated ATPase domains